MHKNIIAIHYQIHYYQPSMYFDITLPLNYIFHGLSRTQKI